MSNRTVHIEHRSRNKLRLPPKPQKWSHQDDLAKMKGQALTIIFHDGSFHHSVLTDADAYTVKTKDGIHFKSGIKTIRFEQ